MFRHSFGRNQTCAMLLGIACGNTFLNAEHSGLNTIGQDIASVAKQAFYDFGERPIWSERMVYGKSKSVYLRKHGILFESNLTVLCRRRESRHCHLQRQAGRPSLVLCQIGSSDLQVKANGRWVGTYFIPPLNQTYSCFLTRPSGAPQAALSDDTLITIQKNLLSLKDLLDRNPHLFHSAPGDGSSSRPPTMEQDAWKVLLRSPHDGKGTNIGLGRANFC